jgi:hypothetical protein
MKALTLQLEQKLRTLGWSLNQRNRAREDQGLAEAWADLALGAPSIRCPGAFSWTGFQTGVEPAMQRPENWTGFRMIRGSHGCTYVRDENGCDRLPPGYSFVEERKAS